MKTRMDEVFRFVPYITGPGGKWHDCLAAHLLNAATLFLYAGAVSLACRVAAHLFA